MTPAQSAKKANQALYALTHNVYYSAIPLDRIFDAVEAAGFAFANQDEKSCFLCGREGKATWDLIHPHGGRSALRTLVVTWYRMDVTGRYEVVAYVS